MKEAIGVEERLFRKSDKPSEDLSCNWHYKNLRATTTLLFPMRQANGASL